MMELQFQRIVARESEDVFQVFTDLHSAPERISGIKKLEVLTDGPVGVGTRFRETREMFRRDSTEEMEISAFERNKSYTIRGLSCGCEFSTEFRFSTHENGTLVEVDMRGKPLTVFARLMAPLGKLMEGSMKKLFEQDLDDLQRSLEGAR